MAKGAQTEKIKLDPDLRRAAIVVVFGTIMAILDTTIVVVALDTLRQTFHCSLSTIQWVTTGYLLALAIVIPATGWAVDRFGARNAWLVSVTLFIFGSLLCAFAWSATSLIWFRVIQGLGGGMIMPIGQAILARKAGPARMGRVMGVVGVPTVLGPVLGPVIGGVIVTYFSWRLIFLVNVPIGILTLALAWAYLERGEANHSHRFDLLGFCLLSPGLAVLVYGLSEVGSNGQTFLTPKVLWCLIIGVVLILLFIWRALVAPEPLLDLRLFKQRTFSIASIAIFCMGGALYGALFLLPFYYQVVRGQSALAAGLMMAPQGIGAAAIMRYGGAVADRRGARAIVPIGMGITLLGTLVYTQLTANTSLWLLGFSLFIRGLGLGLSMMPMVAASYLELSHADVPRASTSTNIFRQVGGSIATAVLAVVLQSQIDKQFHSTSSNLGTLPKHLPPAVADKLATAFANTFWWTIAFTALAIIPTLWLPSHKKVLEIKARLAREQHELATAGAN